MEDVNLPRDQTGKQSAEWQEDTNHPTGWGTKLPAWDKNLPWKEEMARGKEEQRHEADKPSCQVASVSSFKNFQRELLKKAQTSDKFFMNMNH